MCQLICVLMGHTGPITLVLLTNLKNVFITFSVVAVELATFLAMTLIRLMSVFGKVHPSEMVPLFRRLVPPLEKAAHFFFPLSSSLPIFVSLVLLIRKDE